MQQNGVRLPFSKKRISIDPSIYRSIDPCIYACKRKVSIDESSRVNSFIAVMNDIVNLH